MIFCGALPAKTKSTRHQSPARPSASVRACNLVESLNSLSVDIACAPSTTRPRSNSGTGIVGSERNVFTRRLYTLKGQQTFDEIPPQVPGRRRVPQAVDRYCEDFEKLLSDVAKKYRDSMMAQTYLTSPIPARSTRCWRMPAAAFSKGGQRHALFGGSGNAPASLCGHPHRLLACRTPTCLDWHPEREHRREALGERRDPDCGPD